MDKALTVPKWVVINRPKIPQMPKLYQPKLSSQAQKFGILMKKASLGIHSPCYESLRMIFRILRGLVKLLCTLPSNFCNCSRKSKNASRFPIGNSGYPLESRSRYSQSLLSRVFFSFPHIKLWCVSFLLVLFSLCSSLFPFQSSEFDSI